MAREEATLEWESIANFYRKIEDEKHQPPQQDPLISEFWHAYTEVEQARPQLREFAQRFAAFHRVGYRGINDEGLKPVDAVARVRTAFQLEFINEEQPINDRDREAQEKIPPLVVPLSFPSWTHDQLVSHMLSVVDDDDRWGQFVGAASLPINTCIPSRASTIDLHLQAFHEVVRRPLNVLVIGSSTGLVEKGLLRKHEPEYRLGPLAVLSALPDDADGLEHHINERLLPRNITPIVSRIVQTDMFPADRYGEVRRSFASRAPKELGDSEALVRDIALYNTRSDKLSFQVSNLLQEADRKKMLEEHAHDFDFIILANVAYQWQPSELRQIIQTCDLLGAADYQLALIDFADLKGGKLEFLPHRRAWNYRHFSRDGAGSPEQWSGFKEFCRASSGRAREIAPRRKLVSLGGQVVRATDAILAVNPDA